MEYRLFPEGGSWLDLTPDDADPATRLIFACLEQGVLEAWQDGRRRVRLYLPESCGGHLIVDGPELRVRCDRGARAAPRVPLRPSRRPGAQA